MTLYSLELTIEALRKLPSPQYILDLCSAICSRLLEYFYALIPWNNETALERLRCQNAILSWQLGILRSAALGNLDAAIPVKVYNIHVSRRANSCTPCLNQVVVMDRLNEAYPKILIDIFAKLLHCTVVGLEPFLQAMPAPEKAACVSSLTAIAARLRRLITDYLRSRRSDVRQSRNARSFRAKIQVEFLDHIPEFRYLG